MGEKARCKKMLKEMYEMDDQFFKEIDQSISRRCKKPQDVQPYLLQFQAFVQDLMMLTGNLMKFKLRMPSFFKKAIYGMTEKTVHDIYTKNDYKDAGVIKTVVAVREYNKRLNFSEKWATDFVYRVVMLGKEGEPKSEEVKSEEEGEEIAAAIVRALKKEKYTADRLKPVNIRQLSFSFTCFSAKNSYLCRKNSLVMTQSEKVLATFQTRVRQMILRFRN